jgi:hypothetical protein
MIVLDQLNLKAIASKRKRPGSERTSTDRMIADSQVRKTVALPVLPTRCHPARAAALGA